MLGEQSPAASLILRGGSRRSGADLTASQLDLAGGRIGHRTLFAFVVERFDPSPQRQLVQSDGPARMTNRDVDKAIVEVIVMGPFASSLQEKAGEGLQLTGEQIANFATRF